MLSIHKVGLTEAVSSLENGPDNNVHNLSSAARLIALLSSYMALACNQQVSHKAYSVFVAPLQLQIQRAVAELPRWMAVPRAMSAIFISGQSK